MSRDLADAIAGKIAASTGSGWKVGKIDRITITPGERRVYVVDGIPMFAPDLGQATGLARGTQVLWWDGPIPWLLGTWITD